jgi:hypothetical protein
MSRVAVAGRARREVPDDPHWRDYILFYEYFHGDNRAGLGASHQTGRTRLITRLMQMYGVLEPRTLLESGKTRFQSATAAVR